jgi:hypothetical protein
VVIVAARVPIGGDVDHRVVEVDGTVVELVRVGMYCLVAEHHEERPLVIGFDETQCAFGQNVRDIAARSRTRTVLVQYGIDDATLAGKPDPVVEAGPQRRIVPHVPFPDERGLVARALKRLRKRV